MVDRDGWDDEGRRRVRVLHLDQRVVLDAVMAFVSPGYDPRYRIRLKTAPDLTGCTVLSVQEFWERRTFGFMIHHPSFDPVPEGEIVPDLAAGTRWEWEAVDTRPDEVVQPTPVEVVQ